MAEGEGGPTKPDLSIGARLPGWRGIVPAVTPEACLRHDAGQARPDLSTAKSGEESRRPAYALNPAALWLPSQNGLFADCPHRQKNAPLTRVTARPVPVSTSSAPFI